MILGGKISMALYEIFIIGLSTRVLLTGQDRLPARLEVAIHTLCFAVALATTLTYGSIGGAILVAEDQQYTEANERRYNELSSTYADVWVGLFCIVVLLFGHQRWYVTFWLGFHHFFLFRAMLLRVRVHVGAPVFLLNR